MSNHNLTDNELHYLVQNSITVDRGLMEKLCSVCPNEPICYYGLRCSVLRDKIVKRLKNISSEELTELIFTDKNLK